METSNEQPKKDYDKREPPKSSLSSRSSQQRCCLSWGGYHETRKGRKLALPASYFAITRDSVPFAASLEPYTERSCSGLRGMEATKLNIYNILRFVLKILIITTSGDHKTTNGQRRYHDEDDECAHSHSLHRLAREKATWRKRDSTAIFCKSLTLCTQTRVWISLSSLSNSHQFFCFLLVLISRFSHYIMYIVWITHAYILHNPYCWGIMVLRNSAGWFRDQNMFTRIAYLTTATRKHVEEIIG